MKNISIESTVGEIVRDAPFRSRIFENLDIDYCCGGKKSLAEVCRSKNLDASTVIAMLSALDDVSNTATANPEAMSLSELCDHIERVHHDFLREELPRLDFMARKVAAVHGEHEPRLIQIRQLFESFNSEMASHMKDEEENIFPAIRKLEVKQEPSILARSIAKLENEHDNAGGVLAQFKTLTDQYRVPEWACNTFRALYDGLKQLEQNMHQHVHKENNILFPRALTGATD
jgi:regulator of cell morphogenesis and NO signaling